VDGSALLKEKHRPRRCDREHFEGTADRLQAIWGYTTTAVVHPGMSGVFYSRTRCEIERVLNRYCLEKPYLLFVGTWEPRKGLQRLVAAFADLVEHRLLRDHQLVLIGDRGWKDQAIAELLKNQERIRPLGFVDDDSLSALYSGADALVLPSTYEGFGMPVLEARACGTRVVTTDIPELREAGGHDAIYVPPTVDGIRDGILRALKSDRPKPLDNME